MYMKIVSTCLAARKTMMTNATCTGANLAVDIPWKWLNFFLDDDAELESIGKEYAAGKMLTGQIKKRLIEVILDEDGRSTTFWSTSALHSRHASCQHLKFPT